MNEAELYDTLTTVVRQVLDDDSIQLTPETTADQVDGWDSMNHIFIVVELEKRLGIKFQAAEMEDVKSIHELIVLLEEKIAKRK